MLVAHAFVAGGSSSESERELSVGNAEAVPVEDRPYEVVEGSADVPRRVLSGEALHEIIGAEIEEHRRAVEEYRRIGLPTAEQDEGLETLRRYHPR